MPQHTRSLSRRALVGGGLAVLTTGAVSACSNDPVAGGEDTGIEPQSGPWRFTDGLGQEIELDRRPTRIAAYGDAAAALMNFGITPVAIFHYIDPADDPTFEDLDLTGIPIVGTLIGEIEMERLLVEIVPDLVVTTSYTGEEVDAMYGFKGKSQLDKIRKVAPVIGILQAGTSREVIAANEQLVASLGVDVDGGAVAAQRADYEEAAAELSAAADRGLTVVAVYADGTGLWYAKPPDDPALAYYQQLGVRFADVGGDEYYWETVSWENADTIETDLILYSLRTSFTPEQLLEKPVFADLPAAENDQLHPWKFKSMDYPSQAAYMRELAGWLTADQRVT